MRQILQANCDFSAYINSLYPNLNICSEKNIFVGNIFNQNPTKCNTFLSLLKFTLPEIDQRNIESATLCLYFEDLKCFSKSSYNMRIYKNATEFNTSNISFGNLPQISKNNFHEISLSPKDLSKYIEVDITSIVISWLESKENFGLTLTTFSSVSTFLMQISSANASKPPYILISINPDKQSNLNKNSSKEKKDNSSSKNAFINVNKEIQETDNSIYESSSSHNKVDISESFNDKFNSLSTLVTSIDNTVNYILQDLKKIKSNFSDELNIMRDSLKNINSCPNNMDEIIDKINKKIDSIDKKYFDEIEILNNELYDLNHSVEYEKSLLSTDSNSKKTSDEIKDLQEEIHKLKEILSTISIEPLN